MTRSVGQRQVGWACGTPPGGQRASPDQPVGVARVGHERGMVSWRQHDHLQQQRVALPVNPDGSGLRKIPLHGVLTTSFAFDPGWSPNGQKIVFGMFTGGTAGVTKTGPSASSPTARSIARAVR